MEPGDAKPPQDTGEDEDSPGGPRLWALLAGIWFGASLAAGMALLGLYILVVWLRLPTVAGLGDSGDPGPTAYMVEDSCEIAQRHYRPLAEIDSRLTCMVMWSEDWRFFNHDGVDEKALKGALRRNWRRRTWLSGGSTIPMQLARNLYLSRERTLSRKGKEIVIARRLVRRYDRLRILELYLNSAEWAPCVYGVEAAALHYFGHGADHIDAAEASFLAAMLPRPGIRPGHTDADRAALESHQIELLNRAARPGLLSAREHRVAVAETRRVWRIGSWDGHTPTAARAAPRMWVRAGCGAPARRGRRDSRRNRRVPGG